MLHLVFSMQGQKNRSFTYLCLMLDQLKGCSVFSSENRCTRRVYGDLPQSLRVDGHVGSNGPMRSKFTSHIYSPPPSSCTDTPLVTCDRCLCNQERNTKSDMPLAPPSQREIVLFAWLHYTNVSCKICNATWLWERPSTTEASRLSKICYDYSERGKNTPGNGVRCFDFRVYRDSGGEECGWLLAQCWSGPLWGELRCATPYFFIQAFKESQNSYRKLMRCHVETCRVDKNVM